MRLIRLGLVNHFRGWIGGLLCMPWSFNIYTVIHLGTFESQLIFFGWSIFFQMHGNQHLPLLCHAHKGPSFTTDQLAKNEASGWGENPRISSWMLCNMRRVMRIVEQKRPWRWWQLMGPYKKHRSITYSWQIDGHAIDLVMFCWFVRLNGG